MPLKNRVSPLGTIHADAARGTLMGNRGILKGDRLFAHRNWVCCRLSFKGRRRALMQPGHYTELFFLDEATAYAAGHRPCAECRRADYVAFATLWAEVHGPADAKSIDRRLHAERLPLARRGMTAPRADIATLPEGTMVMTPDGPALLWRGIQGWSFSGYTPRGPLTGEVAVLTPPAVVSLLARGLAVQVHGSAG